MPFRSEKMIPMPNQKERVVVQKETVIREIPVQVLNASLDFLTVNRLSVTDLSIPDKSIFYPPNPHVFTKPFINFAGSSPTIELRSNTNVLLSFKNNSLYTNNVNVSSGSFDNISVSKLSVDRIESRHGNEIGGVFMKEGHLTVPGNICADEFVAKTGSIGGIVFREGKSAFTHLTSKKIDVSQICVSDLSCSQAVIQIGGVELSGGTLSAEAIQVESDSCISGVRIHNCGIECDFANMGMLSVNRVDFDCGSFSSFEDRISADVGFITPTNSTNSIGCTIIDKDSLIVDGDLKANTVEVKTISAEVLAAESVCVGGTQLQPNGVDTPMISADIGTITKLSSAHIECTRIDVASEIRADDYKLTDGTSILKGVFPKGIIMMYQGSVPPRGWLPCDGRGGTPRITSPVLGVIYIVRV
jgi:hypothetical protein